jgi:hypothetical protein
MSNNSLCDKAKTYESHLVVGSLFLVRISALDLLGFPKDIKSFRLRRNRDLYLADYVNVDFGTNYKLFPTLP